MKKITVLGSTGSIGTQTLDVVREHPDMFSVTALTCGRRVSDLADQIAEFGPEAVCVGGAEDAKVLAERFPGVEVFHGREGLRQIASADSDIVLNALMGIAGLEPTYCAASKGRRIALANKETLVAGGSVITERIKEQGAELIPVDSEHSAIFQCLEGNRNRSVRRILLTCSGGPFRNFTEEQLEKVTVGQALDHPNWSMGKKITIDSATMMNKGLEVIEAVRLFDVPAEKIDIHVHPESIVHSMVEFEDTSIIAQLGMPDMRIPISYALGYPDRLPYDGESLDFFGTASDLHFERPRRDVFDCINLAYEAAASGDGATVVLNGANEELVSMFLGGRIAFLDIQRTLRDVLESFSPEDPKSVEEILELDRRAREMARKYAERRISGTR
jgi:1-deoxy-D-xylulose-5-phosphate reductoisomerase